MTDADISKLVYESLRLYPGVVGFPVVPLDNKMYYKDTKGGTLKSQNRQNPLSNINKMARKEGKSATKFEENNHDYHRTAFVLAAALRDETVFENPMDFKLRDLNLYESKVCDCIVLLLLCLSSFFFSAALAASLFICLRCSLFCLFFSLLNLSAYRFIAT